MRLYYTPRSHFSRKVRVVLGALGIEAELVDVGNVADAEAPAFGDNPLMKVPTLVDGDAWVLESDHIARYLVRRYDASDPFDVLTEDLDTLNARAVINGIMANEAEVILAERTGVDVKAHRRFDKLTRSIENGLAWLEARASTISKEPCYAAFHLTCMWDHLALYQLVPLEYPGLCALVESTSQLPYVSASKPI